MYTPDLASLRTHRVPDWYRDAKLGLFVHWSLSSVPAYAPRSGNVVELLRARYDDALTVTPYAEWYWNSIKFPDSPAAQYHRTRYGDRPYQSFRDDFVAGLASWDPEGWAEQFAAAGARYVVPITKHHDGFMLWPSETPNPFEPGWQTPRDVVGELAAAVRARGMRLGLYYSGGLDWTFDPTPLPNIGVMLSTVPTDAAYAAYADAHWRELIRRYRPDVLWSDIGHPSAEPDNAALWRLFADYYNGNPDGVVNDRFNPSGPFNASLRDPAALAAFNRAAHAALSEPGSAFTAALPPHWDVITPEYAQFATARPDMWETTRGIGHSFGYAQDETEEDRIGHAELVHLLIDVVAKNGNLLLNVGPRQDGSIPEGQASRLRTLGGFLTVNGPAIYGTRPWERAEGETAEGDAVRFTQRGETVCALVLGPPRTGPLALRAVPQGPVRLLGVGALAAEPQGDGMRVELTPAMCAALAGQHAFALTIGPALQ